LQGGNDDRERHRRLPRSRLLLGRLGVGLHRTPLSFGEARLLDDTCEPRVQRQADLRPKLHLSAVTAGPAASLRPSIPPTFSATRRLGPSPPRRGRAAPAAPGLRSETPFCSGGSWPGAA